VDQNDPASPAAQPAVAHPAVPEPGAPAGVSVPAAPTEQDRPPRRTRRRRRAVAVVASGTLAAGLVLGGSVVALGRPDDTSDGTGLAVAPGAPSGSAFGYGRGTTPGTTSPATTTPGTTTPGGSALPGTGSSGTATLDTTTASAAQQAGVVLVSTVLGYQSAEAAGTGVVLTSDGLVVTNNHVVEGATEITVTIGATGESYTATVVGTDATADVAVLQLQDAAGLTTVALDDDGTAAVGDAVTAVGNAEGGGVLIAADGSITGLEESITTQSEGASAGELLTGLIEVDADVVAGDSGGPLLDDEGEVIGITTAASSGSADITGYAIPIGDVLDVVTQIVAGQDTDAITLGYPAFLGVQIATATTPGTTAAGGATIAGVIEGTPAAQAGLAAGDTVTAVDGTAVADGDALSAALAGHVPGDEVTLTWTTAGGTTATATVTLVAGPAD
jgi:S1-C subfamily serine protease